MSLSENSLHSLWTRYSDPEKGDAARTAHWKEDQQLLHHLGVSMEEVMIYLFFGKHSFNEFETWVKQRVKTNTHQHPPSQQDAKPVLSDADLLFWRENGYLIVPNAVAAEDCDAAVNAICELLAANPSEPDTWYQNHSAKKGMMLQFFDHPTLDKNRRSPRIRKAYEQLYGHSDILLNIDKVSFNPPVTSSHPFTGSPLHWDVSLVPPIPFNLQGLVYLHDVTEDQGAFQCVPGFHLQIDEWLRSLPETQDPRKLIADIVKPVTLAGKKGDLIIWHNALPHCASPNRSSMPRFVQYVTWYDSNRKLSSIWK